MSPGARRALFWSLDPDAPSFRHRLQPLREALESRGWRCALDPLPRRAYGLRVLQRRRSLRQADLLVLHKLKLGIGEHGLVRRLSRRIVLDFDDAIYLRPPSRSGDRRSSRAYRRRRLEQTFAIADLVLAGNETLAAVARPHARRVEVVPTGVDVERYPDEPPSRSGHTVVWIGRPENLPYLDAVRPALAAVAAERPAFRLRVVCSRFPAWDDVPIERVTWDPEREIEALAGADVGIMPLPDDPWARGKCGFKLLQYMAASLPCVASPVGVNREIVDAGSGLLCDDAADWRRGLQRLLDDADLRARMGRSGRARAVERFAQRRIAEAAVSVVAGPPEA